MSFFWYELMTADLDAAEAFYTAGSAGMRRPFDGAPGMPRYTVMNVGERGVGGLMTQPDEWRRDGHAAGLGRLTSIPGMSTLRRIR